MKKGYPPYGADTPVGYECSAMHCGWFREQLATPDAGAAAHDRAAAASGERSVFVVADVGAFQWHPWRIRPNRRRRDPSRRIRRNTRRVRGFPRRKRRRCPVFEQLQGVTQPRKHGLFQFAADALHVVFRADNIPAFVNVAELSAVPGVAKGVSLRARPLWSYK